MAAGGSPAPPPWVWGASLALAAAVGVATLPAFRTALAARARPKTFQTVAVRQFAAVVEPGTFRVIAFGDSALGAATWAPPDMNRRALESRDLDLRYLRLTRAFCVLPHVLASIDAAIDARPDLILLDSWLIAPPANKHEAAMHRAYQAEREEGLAAALAQMAAEPSLLLEHQAFLFDAITGGGPGAVDADAADGGRPPRRRGAGLRCDERNRRRLLRENDRRWRERLDGEAIDPLVAATVDALLARAASRGVRVAFFEVPRALPIEELAGVRQKRMATRELLEERVRGGRVLFLRPPFALDEADTCDYVHMSEHGRDRYSAWLLGEVAALAAEPRS